MHYPNVAGDEMWLAMETKGSDFVFSSLLSSLQLNSFHLISSFLFVFFFCFSFINFTTQE